MSDMQQPPEDQPTQRNASVRRQRTPIQRPTRTPDEKRHPPPGISPENPDKGALAPPPRTRQPGKARRSHPDPGQVSRAGSGLYVPWWGFVVVILVVAAVTCGMWYVVFSSRGTPTAELGPSPTPIFVLITATPTLEQSGNDSLQPSPTPQPTSTSLPPSTETPDPANLPITIGSTIVIAGTDNAGLAVRQGPGVDYTYFFVANDGDVFEVKDGPRAADGYTWWYITDPNDSDRLGWAVGSFMRVFSP